MEYLSVVRSDIQNAVELLSKIKTEIISEKKNLNEIKKEQEKVTSDIKNKNEVIKSVSRKERDLLVREARLVTDREELVKVADKKQAKLLAKESLLLERINRHQVHLNLAMANFETLSASFKQRLSAVKESLYLIRLQKAQSQENYAQILEKNAEAERILETKKEQIKDAERGLSDIKKEQEIQMESKNLFLDGLTQRELKLAKKERNYQVLKLRLDKVLQKLYPKQNIDNLI